MVTKTCGQNRVFSISLLGVIWLVTVQCLQIFISFEMVNIETCCYCWCEICFDFGRMVMRMVVKEMRIVWASRENCVGGLLLRVTQPLNKVSKSEANSSLPTFLGMIMPHSDTLPVCEDLSLLVLRGCYQLIESSPSPQPMEWLL